MTRTLRISLAALLVAIVAGGTVAAVASNTSAAKAKSPTLKLRKTGFGKIRVDKSGRTLYAFGPDKKDKSGRTRDAFGDHNGDKSRCSGQCAGFWPPATAPKIPTDRAGISKWKRMV